jgi:diguanylate cyclase (GGDEF)-like protein
VKRSGPSSFYERHGQRIADAVLSGRTLTESRVGQSADDPAYFAISYIPIKENGVVTGVFEVYVDQTADHLLYQGSLRLTEIILAIAVLLAGGLPSFMVHRKILAFRKSQAETLFLAEHDSLTGVANRSRLEEATREALARSRRDGSYVVALLIDLDRFKEINDSLGHSAGDQVLKAFADRLRSAVRKEDTVARLGGDEFVILQVGIAQPEGASSLTDRLMKILSEPYDIEGLKVISEASIGAAIAPTDATEWDSLLSCADAAMYKAKADGRNNAHFFEPGMDEALRERRHLEVELRRALELQAFQLAYQPIVSFQDGSLVGFEALLRWPEGWTPQSPAAFIPVAESYGSIVPIGAWALETACRTAAAWTTPLKIAVNLSPVQFRQGDVVDTVADALKRTGLDPARLELEVTESLLLQDTDSVHNKLMRLRAMGVSISLDDFGTGYSSLTYLLNFPFDAVKIDQSFVKEMRLEPKAAAIVNTIVALGKTLDLTVTAEGVETPAQALALKEAGCHQAQGYLFSRPLSVSAANAMANECPAATFASASLEARVLVR